LEVVESRQNGRLPVKEGRASAGTRPNNTSLIRAYRGRLVGNQKSSRAGFCPSRSPRQRIAAQ
jgi:hypothetical protein